MIILWLRRIYRRQIYWAEPNIRFTEFEKQCVALFISLSGSTVLETTEWVDKLFWDIFDIVFYNRFA